MLIRPLPFKQIADGLAEEGYALADNFLSPAEVTDIVETDEFRNSKLHLRKAGIGKRSKQTLEDIRGDYIQWIDPTIAPPCVRVYLERLRALIEYLNQNLYLSLKDVEVHRTLYPVGSHYNRHLDQFKTDDHRKLTIICYLNEDWTSGQGGQLRMHLPEGPMDILPLAGRLVCFRSDKVEHEVLPATRERLSITGWAVDRDPNLF